MTNAPPIAPGLLGSLLLASRMLLSRQGYSGLYLARTRSVGRLTWPSWMMRFSFSATAVRVVLAKAVVPSRKPV